jgi:hypothetical protein
MSAIPRSLAWGLILSFALTLMASTPAWAEPITVLWIGPQAGFAGDSQSSEEPAKPITLIRIGPRVGVSGKSPFGRQQKEDFQQYDIAALFGLPWEWQERPSSLKFDIRLLASAGELAAAQDTSLMATVVPSLTVSSPNGTFSIDIGAGTAFFSNYKFGVQNFGGPAQIVGTAGIGLNLSRGVYAGYRFQHFSDAGIYGPSYLGVDMHILELSYLF